MFPLFSSFVLHMSETAKEKTYFPNLDGLRFIAAFSVLLIHIEGIKKREGKEVVPIVDYFIRDAAQMVSIFFVLSGFLITYLLLKEKQDTSTINLKNFYTKRMLRIWPLYYLVGLVGIIILPHFYNYFSDNYSAHANTWLSIILYSLFIPPLYTSLAIGAAWSVRVEELFYMLWPLLLKSTGKYIKLLVGIVISMVLFRNASEFLVQVKPILLFKVIYKTSLDYRFSCMAIGGIAAYLYATGKERILIILYRKDFQYGVYILTLLLLFLKVNLPFINFEFYAVLFALIIINLATNPKSIVSLDYPFMNYLGKISYGIYLYNPIIRILSLEIIQSIYRKDLAGWDMDTLFYSSVIVGTILVSALSYQFLEKPFLRLKNRFGAIKTQA